MTTVIRYTYTITVTENDEDPEIGGFFASFTVPGSLNPGWGRGFGFTKLQAVAALILLKAENDEEVWTGFAGDVVSSTVIRNADLEKSLERHYGGIINYS